MAKIEFWLEYASTYSYLSVARIGTLAAQHTVQIDWQPFWLYPVREEQGLPMPFPDGSARARYMWSDLERRAKSLGLPYRRPETYPFNSVTVGRIATVAAREGWCQEFSERTFRLHWTEGILMSTPENQSAAVKGANQDVVRVLALASSPEIKEAFKQQTTRALERGIFGSPSFVVDGELFWGDDRLESAIEFATSRV